MVIAWDAGTTTLSYSLDGTAISSVSYDVVNQVFGGDPIADFGFGAQTGGAKNEHRVKILSVDSEIVAPSLDENTADGTLIAELAGSDPNSGDTLTFAIVDSSVNTTTVSIFEIVYGDELRIKAGADIDPVNDPFHDLYIQVSDQLGAILVEQFTWTIA